MTRTLPTAFVPAPFIPADAPFTPEQRVWLGGFLSGLTAKLKAGIERTAKNELGAHA